MKMTKKTARLAARRAGAAALIAAIALSLSGCFSQNEISRLSIVMGVGIDEGDAPDNYLVTMQVAKAESLKSSPEGGGASDSKSYSTGQQEAPSIYEALQGIAYKSSRHLYLTHNQVVVVGKAVARKDIMPLLDFFVRDYEGRLNTLLIIADETARGILEEETELERLPALHLRDLLSAQRETSVSRSVMLREFLIASLSKTAAPIAPMLELYATEDGKQKARIGNMAVFKQGRMVGELDKQQVRGLLWLTGEVGGGALFVPVLGGSLGFNLLETYTDIRPRHDGDRFWMQVSIRQVCIINEAMSVKGLVRVENARVIEEAVKNVIGQAIAEALGQARALNADVFGFGEAIYRAYPTESRQLLENWDSEFINLDVDVSIEVTVRSSGSLVEPIEPGGV
jgi:spore germination protein KC